MEMNTTGLTSTLAPALSAVQHNAACEDNLDEDMSDSELSEFEAEIEENLSTASPDSSPDNDLNEHISDERMEIEDSDEEAKTMSTNKGRRRAVVREYYDPELFGLRRSVSDSNPS